MRHLITILGVLAFVQAPAVMAADDASIDQQQPVIDTSSGSKVIGSGFSEQLLAQVVTAGRSGVLTEIRAPIGCDPNATLYLKILGVTAGKPNSTVLSSRTFPGASFPSWFPNPPSLRSLPLSAPVLLTAGQQFAFMLDARGPSPFDACFASAGPVGDSYPGGNLYFDSRPNRPGVWVCVCEFAGGRFDLPFATLMTTPPDDTAPSVSAVISPVSNLAGWHRSDVELTWTIADPESGITSASGCGPVTISQETAGLTLACTATNGAGLSATSSETIRLDRTPPTIGYSGHRSTYDVAEEIDIVAVAHDSLSGIAAVSGTAMLRVPAYSVGLGSHTISATATDRADNTATATAAFTVTVSHGSLCTLTRRLSGDPAVAESLCAKLRAAERAQQRGNEPAESGILNAYRLELMAQTGKSLSPAHSQDLADLSKAL